MLRALAAVPLLLLAGCIAGEPSAPPSEPVDCPETFSHGFDIVVEDMQAGARIGEPAVQEFAANAPPGVPPPSCVTAVEATLRWENGPTAGADLYVGLSAGARSVVGHDRQQTVLDGIHTESVLAPVGASGLARDALHGLTVLVYTDWASASDAGLPAHVELTYHTA